MPTDQCGSIDVRINAVNTPVVILRSPKHGALCIARSLGALGVPIYVADSDRHTAVMASRYCRGGVLLADDNSSPDVLVDRLQQIARKIGKRSILIPTTDDGALFVAAFASELREHFIFPDQSSQLVRSLCSKREMYVLASRLGIPTAHTLFPQCIADVVEFAKLITFPIMLKAIDGQRMWNRVGTKMLIIHSEGQLIEQYKQSEDCREPNLMLQEYIPGGDDTVWMFNGYFDDNSECLFGITGKKLRQYPPYTGATSLGICLQNDKIDQLTRQFMKAVQYRGVLDIGFRYDIRDGQYKVLDVNPRVGATFRLFVDAGGLDVVRSLYLHMTGQPFHTSVPCWGRKWLVEDMDLVSCYGYYRDGNITLGRWLRSLKAVAETAYFDHRDPLPCIAMLANDTRELFRRAIHKSARSRPRSIKTASRQQKRGRSLQKADNSEFREGVG